MQDLQLYKNKKNPAALDSHVGNFVPMESRKAVAKEVKRTHFSLGNDKGIFT
jgi:hypothetical protein